MSNYAYIGKGTIYLQASDGVARSIGNCSKLSFEVSEDKKELMDYETSGGGVADSVSRIKTVIMKVTAHQFSPENLAISLYGDTTASTAATVTDESHTNILAGDLIVFEHFPDLDEDIIVKVSGTPDVTLTEDTDYTITPVGVQLIADGGADDGDTLKVTYKSRAENLVKTFIEAAQEYIMKFVGLNEARSNNPVYVEVFRVKFSPTTGLDLIGDDFANLSLEAEILKDTTRGTGLSQFFNVRIA